MAVFPSSVRALLAGMDDDSARRKPESGAWSILEIVSHLAIEEAEDFRPRLQSTLEDPEKEWPGIDPEGAIVERKCNEGSLSDALATFDAERATSIQYLLSLIGEDVAWDNTYEHPSLKGVTAGELMVSWALHDTLHLAQLSKRLSELVVLDGGGYPIGYATG